VILFKIDPKRLTLFPLKGDTPRSIYVDAVTFWYAKKAVEIESCTFKSFTTSADPKLPSVVGNVIVNPGAPLGCAPFNSSLRPLCLKLLSYAL